MVKILTSNAGGIGLLTGWRAKILHTLWPKSQNINTEAIIQQLKDFKSLSKTIKKIFKKINLKSDGIQSCVKCPKFFLMPYQLLLTTQEHRGIKLICKKRILN